MLLRLTYHYRNLLILWPLIPMFMTSLFFAVGIADIRTGGSFIRQKPPVQTVCEPCADHPKTGPHTHTHPVSLQPNPLWVHVVFLTPFLVFLSLSVRSVLSYCNERIVLTDTGIERYGYLGEMTLTAPRSAIQRLEFVTRGNNIATYRLVTEKGIFLCSDAMVGFKGFQSRIAEIIAQNQKERQQRTAAEQRERMQAKALAIAKLAPPPG